VHWKTQQHQRLPPSTYGIRHNCKSAFLGLVGRLTGLLLHRKSIKYICERREGEVGRETGKKLKIKQTNFSWV